MKHKYSVIYQSVVVGSIVMVSKAIEVMLPVKMPASVIGLVLLFIALSANLIKLEQVETVADSLVANIGLFFVPAGVSVINSLGILQEHLILNTLLIFISTLLLLVGTGWMTQLLMAVGSKKLSPKSPKLLGNPSLTKTTTPVVSELLAK
ncbi:antiholin-like murein hydrolase modulator LrgA [Streptococcus phocae subsp. salmonis]|uniref:antiholin-like murein hydrolase modulator LrgA n=1 Tax=Streptococcus phocae TaxID=119224 RepID=UPI000531CA74|nr:antiholin-like murein hydrolase modulator LrgA [Streptococcus phocae]KGR73486.1 murein hydrolase transporter LrgA [Streptococcus phocae subsp. salmonis]